MAVGDSLKVISLAVNQLIPYVNNSRTHSDEQIVQIASSIQEFGFTNPLLIDEKKGIIAGHGRLLAAKKLDYQTIPTITLCGLTEAQRKAYIIADNQLALNAGWDIEKLKIEIQGLDELDFNLDLLGFHDVDQFLFNEIQGLTDDDAVPDVPDKPISKPGDIWLLGEHRVMCGDSTKIDDVEKLLNGRTIDLIFTDPPYGVSYASKNEFLNSQDKGNRIQTEIINDHLTIEETGQLWADVFSVWSQYFSDYASYYVSSPQGGDLFLMMMMMNDNGMPVKHTIIWNKNNHVLGRCDYNYKHEPIMFGWSKTHKFYAKGEFKNSVWDIDKPLKNDLHPTMKPVALVENCIKNSSSNNQIIADLFLGSGTTVIAAEKNNRLCYGMELSPSYVDVIISRWQDYTGKQAVLESSGQVFEKVAHDG
jgi:DNA modification methylase